MHLPIWIGYGGTIVTFRKRSLLERSFMPQEKFNQYYRDKRKYEYENGITFIGIKMRKYIHGLVLGIVKMNNRSEGITYRVLHDKRVITKQPVIYACTHSATYSNTAF